MLILIFVVIGIILFFVLRKKYKFPKVGAIAVVTGGVKCGKSAVSVSIALSNFKRVQRIWRISCFFVKFFNCFRFKNKLSLPERPLLYSSIPLRGISYIPLTREHLLRKKRFAYKSVVLIDEASLVADSMLIKDKEINTELLLFFKLFGHETKGGLCVLNTHNITDLHFALKRCTSQYFYVHSLVKYIPFICFVGMREERYSEDGTVLNNYDKDVEETTKHYLMFKKVFKRYDSYCFSYLTDDLPCDDFSKTIYRYKNDSLKADEVVSFRPEFYNLNKGGVSYEKKDS